MITLLCNIKTRIPILCFLKSVSWAFLPEKKNIENKKGGTFQKEEQRIQKVKLFKIFYFKKEDQRK